jgi:hypothetical protein
MPDSRSWVTLTGGEKSLYAVMQGLDTPEVQARTALGYPRGTVVWPDLMGSTLLGCTGPRRVLATPNTDRSPRRGKPRSIPFYAFDVGAGPAHLVQYAVTLPEGRDAGEVALSPEGKRLAWLLHEVPEVHDAPGPLASVQVAVSGTDGTSMQVLAILRRKEFGEERNAPRKLHWSPDGKEIRFSFAGFEWAAPAPEQP